MDLSDPTAFALGVTEILRREGVAHALYGGQVFGGLSVSRITLVDADELNSLDLVEPLEPAYAQRALARSSTSTLRGQGICVLGPEDFVIFKILSTRDLDLIDAASVLRSLGADLDLEQIEREAEVLASALPSHPVRRRWERIRSGRL